MNAPGPGEEDKPPAATMRRGESASLAEPWDLNRS